MFNKSEIMKEAWRTFKSGMFDTFGQALEGAWHNAKTITGKELKKGDVVKVEYGEYDNWVTCTVLSIGSKRPFGYYVVNAIFEGRREFEFCIRADERVYRLAA